MADKPKMVKIVLTRPMVVEQHEIDRSKKDENGKVIPVGRVLGSVSYEAGDEVELTAEQVADLDANNVPYTLASKAAAAVEEAPTKGGHK